MLAYTAAGSRRRSRARRFSPRAAPLRTRRSFELTTSLSYSAPPRWPCVSRVRRHRRGITELPPPDGFDSARSPGPLERRVLVEAGLHHLGAIASTSLANVHVSHPTADWFTDVHTPRLQFDHSLVITLLGTSAPAMMGGAERSLKSEKARSFSACRDADHPCGLRVPWDLSSVRTSHPGPTVREGARTDPHSTSARRHRPDTVVAFDL